MLEAVGWLATQRSLRGAPRDVLVRSGASRAILRAETMTAQRQVLIEAELPATGTARAQVNRQPVRKRADLAEAVRVTVFSPDDLHLVQDGPAGRREYLDDVLVDQHPRFELLTSEVDRVLRQRASVLRQAGNRLDADIVATLDVWDDRLAAAGSELAEARQAPRGGAGPAGLRGLWAAGRLGRTGDPFVPPVVGRRVVRRPARPGGPRICDGRSPRSALTVTNSKSRWAPARPGPTPPRANNGAWLWPCAWPPTNCGAGDCAEPPVLLLDDVFSELDSRRSASLVEQLPAGQVLLTTAVDPPAAVTPDRLVEVAAGRLSSVAGRP